MTVRGLSMRFGCAAAALALLIGGASAQDVGSDQEYEPGEGYHEEEWYDPSDWFDDDDGVDYEYDDIYGRNGSDYDDDGYGDYGYFGDPYDYWDYYDEDEMAGDGDTYAADEYWEEDEYETGYGGEYRDGYDSYYTNDWFDGKGVFDGWYEDAF